MDSPQGKPFAGSHEIEGCIVDGMLLDVARAASGGDDARPDYSGSDEDYASEGYA